MIIYTVFFCFMKVQGIGMMIPNPYIWPISSMAKFQNSTKFNKMGTIIFDLSRENNIKIRHY